MKTDALIDMLVRGDVSVDQHAGKKRFAIALFVAALSATLLATMWLGVRPDIAQAATMPLFWIKAALPGSLIVGALWATSRLSRPGVHAGTSRVVIGVPVVAVWVGALLASWSKLASVPVSDRRAVDTRIHRDFLGVARARAHPSQIGGSGRRPIGRRHGNIGVLPALPRNGYTVLGVLVRIGNVDPHRVWCSIGPAFSPLVTNEAIGGHTPSGSKVRWKKRALRFFVVYPLERVFFTDSTCPFCCRARAHVIREALDIGIAGKRIVQSLQYA
jgi:hypothetical protein